MFCKLTWKNNNKTAAVISVKNPDGVIPWDNKETLIGTFDNEKKILILKAERDFLYEQRNADSLSHL